MILSRCWKPQPSGRRGGPWVPSGEFRQVPLSPKPQHSGEIREFRRQFRCQARAPRMATASTRTAPP